MEGKILKFLWLKFSKMQTKKKEKTKKRELFQHEIDHTQNVG